MWENRGVSPVIGIILLVAITVIIAGVTAPLVLDMSSSLHEPSLASVDAEEITFETDGNDDPCSDFEKGVVVTLTNYQQADRIYVIAHSEGGENLKEVWEDPSVGDVGTSKMLANEDYNPDGNIPSRFSEGEFIDIGGSEDYSYCLNNEATFDFYAESDGQKNHSTKNYYLTVFRR
jgi:archaeal flagellin N-terminal-like domain